MAFRYAGKFEDLRKPPTPYRDSTGHSRTAGPEEVGRVLVLHGTQCISNVFGNRHVNVFTGFLLVVHFQRFKPNWATCAEGDPSLKLNLSPPVNSMEMHSDGSVFVAFTPPCSPTWYDTFQAHEFAADSGRQILAGQNGTQAFSALKDENVTPSVWPVSDQAFPAGHGAAPRWIVFRTRVGVPPNNWTDTDANQIQTNTGALLLDSRNYCFKDTIRPGIPVGDPGQWQPVLPIGEINGQKKFFRDSPISAVVGGTTNHFVTWNELQSVAQSNPPKVSEILEWNGHPNSDDIGSRTIAWLATNVEGTVTNSFLSGDDATINHREAPNWSVATNGSAPPSFSFNPDTYWLGTAVPTAHDPCTASTLGFIPTGGVQSSLCNDWVVYVFPDPTFWFMLAATQNASDANCCANEPDRGLANFDAEHKGNLENEVEQWLVPVGFRPDPGDRINMTGRYAVDCGHSDWHAELHPIQSYVSSHTQGSSRPNVVGGTELVATLVVTGGWDGNTLDFDIWPAARLAATAQLKFEQENCCHDTGGQGIAENISIVQRSLLPADDANHMHITLVSTTPPAPLGTDRWGQVQYDFHRRLAIRIHLWWEGTTANPSSE